jgi:HD-GYP domain-containing protein (c-di-GMP phosphodiesterase class II)
MRRKQIPVEQLVPGMYVAELDRPWTETPFAFQGFVLRSDAQMDALHKLCKTVWIDLDLDETDESSAAPAATPLAGLRRQTWTESAAIEHEMGRARDVFFTAETAVATALADFAKGTALDAPVLKAEVTRITDSVLRNPHAVALLATMREGAEFFVDRALNTSVFLIVFARFLGMERADIERAGIVGLLQDISMATLPREIVTKKGTLSPAETALVRTHVETGIEKIGGMKGLGREIADLAAMHHERHDGSGYPKGLKAAQIPTIGACSALVDTYVAMTRPRPYAEPIPPSKVLGLLHRWRGKSFHPTLVDEFIRCMGAFPVGSVVELNSGEIGVVVSQDPTRRLQPRVMVVKDARGNPVRPQKILDLARSPMASPGELYRIRRTLEYGRAEVSVRDLAIS